MIFKLKCWRKIFFISAAVFLLLFGFKLLARTLFFGFKPAVIFFDVGQGDAALIRTPPGQNILIDGGPDNSVLKKLGKFLPYFSRRLDLLVLSHYHDDHATGLIEVLRRYDVKNIIYASGGESGLILETFLKEAELKNKAAPKISALTGETTIILSDSCRLRILNPLMLDISKDDNNSLITKLSCGGRNWLWSGDNSTKVENKLLESNFDFRTDVFKASHHGSKTANSLNFLRALGARFLIISVGAANRFGHPNQEVLDRANELKIKINRTDLEGDSTFLIPSSN
jgi:competence protein ComEC